LGLACGGAGNGASASDDPLASEPCATGQPLAGASYDIAKSRFAFGSTPVAVDAGALVRWTGSEGVVAIWSDGAESASLNGGAPAANLPGWSGDGESLDAHVVAYFESMGVQPCQIASTGEESGAMGGGPTDGSGDILVATPTAVSLARGVQGVNVRDSLANAEFDSNDQTTEETLYWPEIPADVVSAALVFQAQLAAPGALAAYKAKLPTDAQGPGSVVIHHSSMGTSAPFVAAAVYDTVEITPDDSGGDIFFDPNGNPVTPTWQP
jgi:hypothetical protein